MKLFCRIGEQATIQTRQADIGYQQIDRLS
jgi:hypothetical protein